MYAKGDRVLAFDYRIWVKRGYDHDGNRDCWLPATVARGSYVEPKTEWSPGGQMMIDLKFDHLEDVSHGHFHHAIQMLLSPLEG